MFSADPLPVLALTVPTPMIPQSPVFVSQSPVTLHKFVAASDRFLDETATVASPYSVPMLPDCEECSKICRQREEFHDDEADEEVSGKRWFCRACHRQWLACQVWYQASDGGRRQQLREPFIRPGEANSSNRAIMETLGIPVVGFRFGETGEPVRGLVIGMRDVSDGAGLGRRLGYMVNKKLRRSLRRTVRRFSDGDQWARVDEMGQMLDDRRSPEKSRTLFGIWDSVKATLRRRS